MTDSERLKTIERRIEVVIQGLIGMALAQRTTTQHLEAIREWLEKPPGNELSDALRDLGGKIDAQRLEIAQLTALAGLALRQPRVAP